MPAKHQFSALKYALASTANYLNERTSQSIIPILPDEPTEIPTLLPMNGVVGPSPTPGTTPAATSGGQTTTVAASTGYTPSGLGVGTGATRSVSTGAVGAGPGTPAAGAASPQPGIPGAGKKKRRRE